MIRHPPSLAGWGDTGCHQPGWWDNSCSGARQLLPAVYLLGMPSASLGSIVMFLTMQSHLNPELRIPAKNSSKNFTVCNAKRCYMELSFIFFKKKHSSIARYRSSHMWMPWGSTWLPFCALLVIIIESMGKKHLSMETTPWVKELLSECTWDSVQCLYTHIIFKCIT